MLSMKDIKRIVPTKVYLDLPTRVTVAESEFFGTKGSKAYQLKLCEQLHAKCVTAVTHEMGEADSKLDEAMDLVIRMDALILKGLKKTEQPPD